jgi:uncharacterized protein YdeI (YjbR/CyaY-like superfamily)
MAKPDNQLETFHATNRQQWREWLEKNHHTSLGVWLIYYKVKSGKPSIRYNEAVKEVLCFGWIDSKVKSIDSERYMQIWIESAKRPETRLRRIEQTISSAVQNKNPLI